MRFPVSLEVDLLRVVVILRCGKWEFNVEEKWSGIDKGEFHRTDVPGATHLFL